MQHPSFGIIGYGKMGASIVKGAIGAGILAPTDVIVYDKDALRLEVATNERLNIAKSISEISSCCHILIAVKPKDVPSLGEQLKALLPKGKVLAISIAAGITLSNLESRLGDSARIIRVMPNIAAAVNEAASAFVPNKHATKGDVAFVSKLLNSIGVGYLLDDESMIDAVTGLSGSGPAYFFYIMKALEEVGLRSGLPAPLVRSLVSQTCRGSGAMAAKSDAAFDQLIRFVASPGGTTEEALKVIDAKGVSSAMIEAVTAAIEKSKRMNY